ncbi:MAG: insulinase family protein [Acidobacteria bacterium]|nr:insulinase family protein [Acidobacteriota bacterium]
MEISGMIQKEVLPNGLTLITESMEHVRSVAIGVWIKSGSRRERAPLNGISHFIEHMVFKGTESRTAQQIAKTIDSIGGQMDAFTAREYICFYTKVLDEHLPLGVDLLSDIVLNPLFPDEEIEKERNVIYEEINMVEDSPHDLVHEILTENFWKGHPLGRPILGTKESVAKIGRQELFDYFRECYTAANILIAAAGNLDHRKVVEAVKRNFDPLPQGGPIPEEGVPPEPHPVFLSRNKNELEQTHLCLGTLSPSLASEDRFAAHVLNNVLGGGLSSRLFQNIREKRGLVYAIFSGLSLYKDAGCMTIYAGTATRSVPEVVELILVEMRGIKQDGVEADELRRSIENLKGGMMLSLENTSDRMITLAQHEIYFGRQFTLDEILSGIESVRAQDVTRVARQTFDPRFLSLTVLGRLDGLQLDRGCLQL